MNFKHAVVRLPGENFGSGETTMKDANPDFHRMREQHGEYIRTLKKLGLDVIVLDPLPGHPDAYFVEDTAVITPEVCVITSPGAESRKGEEDGIELIMSRFREIVRIMPPGTLDGGDVLQAEKSFFVGISGRTNPEGAEQLAAFLGRFGYSTVMVRVEAGLHLKSGVNYLGNGKMLMTGSFAGMPEFSGYERIILNEGEEYAANTLVINGSCITPAGFPGTLKKLSDSGYPVISLDVSEAAKMDGGLTCMSLRF